jgi:sensor histidine kinase regulating citrate/malate metabolism
VEIGSTERHLHPAKHQSSAIDQLNNCRTNVPESEGPVNLHSDAKKGWAVEISELKYLVNSLELILNNVYSGIIFCDREYNIIFMNQVYAELLGVDRNEVVGKPISEFFPDSRLPLVLRSGKAEFGQQCSLRGEIPFLVNRLSIKKGNKTIGIILQSIFKDYASFKELVARLNLLETKVNPINVSLTVFFRPGIPLMIL